MSDVYPSGRYSEDTEQLQRELIAGGYLPAYTSEGKPSDDGWYGPKTRAAQQQREQDLAEMPAPAVAWWRTRRAKGAVTALAGMAALFVPALREVDTGYLIELIWTGLDHADQIITAAGAIATLAGTIWGAIGAAKAKAPIDTGLVARVAGRELRLPERLHLPAAPGRGAGGGSARNRGPFNDGH